MSLTVYLGIDVGSVTTKLALVDEKGKYVDSYMLRTAGKPVMAVQGRVWADEVVEKDEHGNEVVGGREGGKSLFGLVPSLELLVEALNEVVGNVIVEALHADVLNPVQRLDRHLIGEVTVTHNGARGA